MGMPFGVTGYHFFRVFVCIVLLFINKLNPVAYLNKLAQRRFRATRFRLPVVPQRTSGGIDIRIDSVRPPVCRPNRASCPATRLNSRSDCGDKVEKLRPASPDHRFASFDNR